MDDKARKPGEVPTMDFSLPNLPFTTSSQFFIISQRQQDAEKNLEELLRNKKDTAGCCEQFKLAGLLSRRHKNKQFSHSSQNRFWHVVRSHPEKVTFFLSGAAGGRTSLIHIIWWEARDSAAHLPLFSNPTLCFILMNWVWDVLSIEAWQTHYLQQLMCKRK